MKKKFIIQNYKIYILNWDYTLKSYCYGYMLQDSFTLRMKRYIEEDNPYALSSILLDHKNVSIYALICCFEKPSLKCIDFLVRQGIPLDQSFGTNPFDSSPLSYLKYNFTKLHPSYFLIKQTIEDAIDKYHTVLNKQLKTD